MRPRLMYLESKAEGNGGPASIGFVALSKTGRTLRYRGREFQRIRGGGIRGNFVDLATGDEWWISGPKRNGGDRLFGALGIEVDEDAREAYWRGVRGFRGARLPATA